MESTLELIREKIAVLKTNYNSDCHFNKCLSEREIKKFEDKTGIQLPNDYRSFLLEIGNGGPFGFRPLDLNAEHTRINTPFPLTKAFIETIDNEDLIDRDGIFSGQISIESGGCGNYTFLVVKGPEYGNVWWFELPSNGELIPFTGFDWENRLQPNVRKKFAEWFADLLDLEIERKSNTD